MSGVDATGGAVLRPLPGAGEETAKALAGGNRPPPAGPAGNERLPARVARADRYFDEHLKKQRDWYSKRASAHKSRSQWLSFVVIFVGALITFVQVLPQIFGPDTGWALAVPAVTAALGVAVAVLTGVQRIWKFDESWPAYRRASEQMKREYRLYINGAGAYPELADEDEAYRRFVETTEAIIAEEQQIYWKSRTDDRKDGAEVKSKPGQGGGQG